MKGLSDKADYTSAMTLFKDAAAKGSGQAAMNLARLAFLGLGMEKNDAIGAAWVQEAANSGAESAAQALMGILYLGGIGVPQDFNKARQWLQTSSEPEAEELATQIAMMGNAVDILPPEEKEAAWEKIYAEAEADIREAFNAILEKGTAPRSSYKGRK
jgi:TPR repeat protein